MTTCGRAPVSSAWITTLQRAGCHLKPGQADTGTTNFGWMDSGEYFFFESDFALKEAVAALRALPAGTKKLLSDCIEHQGVIRQSVSAAARALESAGFVIIADVDGFFSSAVRISPTLAGEEAVLALEASTPKPSKRKR